MCSLSSYKQRERRECGYPRRFYRLNVYTTNLYPPTGNLDTRAGSEIMGLLKQSNRRYRQTVIMITHNLELAKQADRVLTIEDGRVSADRKGGEWL